MYPTQKMPPEFSKLKIPTAHCVQECYMLSESPPTQTEYNTCICSNWTKNNNKLDSMNKQCCFGIHYTAGAVQCLVCVVVFILYTVNK